VKLQNNVNQITKKWKYVNSNFKSQTRIGGMRTVPSDKCVVIPNDDMDKANIFGNYFSCVHTESEGKFKELPHRGPAVSCKDVAFSEEAILDKLNINCKMIYTS